MWTSLKVKNVTFNNVIHSLEDRGVAADALNFGHVLFISDASSEIEGSPSLVADMLCMSVCVLAQLLLSANERAARERDGSDRLPLHLAAEHGAPVEVVKALLRLYPEAVTKPSGPKGWTPVHCAVAAPEGSGVPALEVLLQEEPRSAAMCDHEGRLPLRLAVEHQVSLRGLRLLLRAYPEAVFQTDREGLLPWELPTASQATVAALVATFAAVPDSTKAREAWHKALALPDAAHGVGLAVARSRDLALTWTLPNGLRPQDSAHQKCRAVMDDAICFLGRYRVNSVEAHRTDSTLVLLATDDDEGSNPVTLKLVADLETLGRELELRQVLSQTCSSQVLPELLRVHVDSSFIGADALAEGVTASLGPTWNVLAGASFGQRATNDKGNNFRQIPCGLCIA
eukprot:scaffold213622_cov43-Prasinocladus_malaysianus.AAC.3